MKHIKTFESLTQEESISENLLKVKNGIENGKLKILRGGKKRYGKLILNITELVWARNFNDGFLIDVYDENNNYEGTIEYVAPDYIPKIK